MSPLRTVLRLAAADVWADRTLALCNVLALAAVLAPLLVLAGLRHGVVAGLREMLLENPRAREIVTAANRTLPAADIEAVAHWPGVEFLVPLTRTLATTLLMQSGDAAGPTARLELLPTKAGDPLLKHALSGDDQVVLSTAAAARLRAGVGSILTGRLARRPRGVPQTLALRLKVVAVAPAAAFDREGAFVTLPLELALEDWQETDAPWPGTVLPPPARPDYAGFRLYADRLDEVPALDRRLRAAGFVISSHAGEVASIEAVDAGLGALFDVVAALGAAGFLLSSGAGLWANVERKRMHLALMRFLGLRRAALALLVVLQAVALAACGTAVGVGAAFGAAVGINGALAGLLALHRPLCVISPGLVAGAFAIALPGAAIVAILAGARASRVEPWEGVSTPA